MACPKRTVLGEDVAAWLSGPDLLADIVDEELVGGSSHGTTIAGPTADLKSYGGVISNPDLGTMAVGRHLARVQRESDTSSLAVPTLGPLARLSTSMVLASDSGQTQGRFSARFGYLARMWVNG